MRGRQGIRRGQRIATNCLALMTCLLLGWFLFAVTQYRLHPTPESSASSGTHRLPASIHGGQGHQGSDSASRNNFRDAAVKTRTLTLEEQEEILKEDHRFLKVLKKKVEAHEHTLRELQSQESHDYSRLSTLLNRTREELDNQLFMLEGKQLRANAKEQRFEERIGARERLVARTVRLGQQQIDAMERWIGDAVRAIQETNEQSLHQLKDQVVQALLEFSKQLGESDHLDESDQEIIEKKSRPKRELNKRTLLSIIEEIARGELLTPRTLSPPSSLLAVLERRKITVIGEVPVEQQLNNAPWEKLGVIAVAKRDYAATSADELHLRGGEEVTVLGAVPGDLWWRVKNREGKDGLVPSSWLKWYDEEANEYIDMGNQWDRNVTEDELEVQKTIKSREQEIWRLENENARLRLRLNTEDKDNDDDQGSCGNGERNRQKALHSVILPEIRKIIKDYGGGEEEWEEMERRHHVWKDWTPDPKDLHTLHLFSGIHPDDHEEVSYRWRKDGMLTMKRQIEVLLEADQWKREATGRFLLYQPPPGRERNDEGLNLQILEMIEALAWAKLLGRTLVIPLFGDGSSENYYHPDKAAGVYVNISSLGDYAPVLPWHLFLKAFASKKESAEKQKTVDIKDRLIDLIDQEGPKKVVFLQPSTKKSAPNSVQLSQQRVEIPRKKGKIVRLGEYPLKEADHTDPGHLHTRMVRFVVPAEHISRADEGTRTEETDQRNYFLKSQGLSIDGVDDVLWDHNLLGLGIEQQITQVFGDGSDRADQELLVFNSLLGFYDVPRPFLHALLHAALRLPTPLMEKAHEFITAMAHRGSERVPYVAIHLRRSKVFREHCRDVKERKVYASSEKIIDKSLVYDRCYTAMEDVIHRLKAIKEVGNYSCVFVATDLSPGDQEDILLRDFPWVTGEQTQIVTVRQPSTRELFPAKFDRNHMELVELVVCAHAELFVGNLYAAFSKLTAHYRHVLGHPSETSMFL